MRRSNRRLFTMLFFASSTSLFLFLVSFTPSQSTASSLDQYGLDSNPVSLSRSNAKSVEDKEAIWSLNLIPFAHYVPPTKDLSANKRVVFVPTSRSTAYPTERNLEFRAASTPTKLHRTTRSNPEDFSQLSRRSQSVISKRKVSDQSSSRQSIDQSSSSGRRKASNQYSSSRLLVNSSPQSRGGELRSFVQKISRSKFIRKLGGVKLGGLRAAQRLRDDANAVEQDPPSPLTPKRPANVSAEDSPHYPWGNHVFGPIEDYYRTLQGTKYKAYFYKEAIAVILEDSEDRVLNCTLLEIV